MQFSRRVKWLSEEALGRAEGEEWTVRKELRELEAYIKNPNS